MKNHENKNPGDNFGKTPLHVAAEKGNFDACKVILKHVQEKNPVSNGSTPLMLAAKNKHFKVCELIANHCQQTNNE